MTLHDESPSHLSNGELVQWMEGRRVRLGRAGVSPTMVTAFALGVAATVAAFAALRWIAPRREALPPWRWGRGPLH